MILKVVHLSSRCFHPGRCGFETIDGCGQRCEKNTEVRVGMLETMTCLSACSHDSSFVVRIVSRNTFGLDVSLLSGKHSGCMNA